MRRLVAAGRGGAFADRLLRLLLLRLTLLRLLLVAAAIVVVRAIAAAMPAPAMPETILVVAVRIIVVVLVEVLSALLLRLLLPPGDERRQAARIAFIAALLRLIVMLLMLRPVMLLAVVLIVLLMLRVGLLSAAALLHVRLRLVLPVARLVLIRLVAIVLAVVEIVAALLTLLRLPLLALLRLALLTLLPVIRILLAELLLRGGDEAEVVLGVLVVVFGGHRIAGALRVARELDVFFRDVRGGAADLHIRPVRLVDPRQRILVSTLVVVMTPAHTLLTVSHVSPLLTSLCRGNAASPKTMHTANGTRANPRGCSRLLDTFRFVVAIALSYPIATD